MGKYRQQILPFIVLSVLVAFTYSLFDGMPYLGFYYSYLDEITDVFTPEAEMFRGGILRKVNGVDWSDLKNDIYRPLFPDLNPGDQVWLTIEKDGRWVDYDWTLPENISAERAARLRSTWWLPAIFWLAGTLTWFNIRPRNRAWRLLVAFNWIIALYLAGLNGPSLGNLMLSVPFVRLLGCLVLPIFLHLHWEFPYPLPPFSRQMLVAIYGISTLIGVLSAVNLLPGAVPIAISVLSVICVIFVMVYKRFVQPDHIADNRFVLYTFGMIILPPLVTTIFYTYLAGSLEYFGFTASYMAMPALPAVYFLIAFEKQMYSEHHQRRIRWIFIGVVLVCSLTITGLLILIGNRGIIIGAGTTILFVSAVLTLAISILLIPMLGLMRMNPALTADRLFFTTGLQPRSNRLITPYFFLVAFGIVVGLLLVVFESFLQLELREVEVIAVTGFIVATATLVFYPWFGRLVERRLFGASNPPSELVEVFARRITTSLSLTDLSNLLVRDVMPTLLIRQSSLHYINGAGNFETLFASNTPGEDDLDMDELVPFLPKSGQPGLVFSKVMPSPFPEWVQVVIPLQIGQKLIGIWLLGSHDPDDEYNYLDLNTLHVIANQTAIALSNILLTNQLHAHYQADIDREEADRIEVARGLHDHVLNQLASLAMEISAGRSRAELLQSYEKIKFNLRELILRLRPAVLDFGLSHAIHDLSSQLMDSFPETSMSVQLPFQSPRYDPKVEGHIFTIVQHVCENAFQHSRAKEIIVSGAFEEGLINLAVVDDGIGFNYEELNLSQLIEKRHFGLVGVRERAELIRANLVFDSSPGSGTRVYLRWEMNQDD